jgi:hypothetical protein
MVLLPSGFPTKTLCTPLPSPYAPHAQPISFFSILPPAQYWVRITDIYWHTTVTKQGAFLSCLFLFIFTPFTPQVLVSFPSYTALLICVAILTCPSSPFRLAHIIYLLLGLILVYPLEQRFSQMHFRTHKRKQKYSSNKGLYASWTGYLFKPSPDWRHKSSVTASPRTHSVVRHKDQLVNVV